MSGCKRNCPRGIGERVAAKKLVVLTYEEREPEDAAVPGEKPAGERG